MRITRRGLLKGLLGLPVAVLTGTATAPTHGLTRNHLHYVKVYDTHSLGVPRAAIFWSENAS